MTYLHLYLQTFYKVRNLGAFVIDFFPQPGNIF